MSCPSKVIYINSNAFDIKNHIMSKILKLCGLKVGDSVDYARELFESIEIGKLIVRKKRIKSNQELNC